MATYNKKNWEESEELKKQKQAIADYALGKPTEYKSQYQQISKDALDAWQNRKPFQYDINADMLYNQYKNNYMTQGNLAMQDTIGQAAALTGGYGNSYAQSVGQQTYQNYLRQLNDIVPELYNSAYSKYQQEGNDLYNKWQAAQSLEAQDYSRYRDTLQDYNAGYDRLMNEYNTAYDREYGQWQYDDQMAYQQYQDAIAQEQWQKQFDAEQAYREWQKSQARASAAKAATKTVAFDNGNVSTANIKKMQEYLGISPSGYWDEVSYNAAGKKTADEALRLFNSGSYVDEDGITQTGLSRNDAYINNYLASAPSAANNSYQYAGGMYNTAPSYDAIDKSWITRIQELQDSGNDDKVITEVRRLLNRYNLSPEDEDYLKSFIQ